MHLCVVETQQLSPQISQDISIVNTNSNAEAICFLWETVQQAALQPVHSHKHVIYFAVH